VRNGPKILDQLVAGHPNAGIRNGNRVSSIVGVYRNCQGPVRLENFGARSLQKPELFRGIRRIRDELANEDLLIRVERVDDDIEELGDLRLKLVLFNLTHEMCLIRRTRHPVKNTETLNSQLSTIRHP
jgi:hypothetical protein